MPSVVTRHVTPKEYLERERQAETRSEYRNGESVARAGASFRHALIVSNLVLHIRLRLGKRPCHVIPSDLQLAVQAANLITYPDVMVICDDPAFAYDRDDVVLNPVVIVEVLSKSTQKYDRGEKFAAYRSIPSLRDYVMVAQDRIYTERWSRQPDDQWTRTEFTDAEATIALESITIELRVADLYEKVKFFA
jgi:Uma2 family endonuclease